MAVLYCTGMMVYEFLAQDSVSDDDIAILAGLLEQLLDRPVALDRERVQRAMSQARILVARNHGRVVGTGSLYVLPLLHGSEGRIEEVVVDEARRGQGVGREITTRLIQEARAMGVEKLFLTSNPARLEANQLYTSMGFERYETNVYRMKV
jgi:N-acetylglutamate synthase-like GNAT family acetyltransferase